MSSYDDVFDQALIDFEGIALGQCNLHGQWTRVNRALCDLLGYSPEDLLAKKLQELVHADDRARILNTLSQFRNGDTNSRRSENRFLRKDGSTVWFDLSVTPILGSDGRPVRLSGAAFDISERKRTEQALVDSEILYRRLSEEGPAFVCSFLPDGTLTYVNSSLAALVNLRPDELIGRNYLDFLPPADAEKSKSDFLHITPEMPNNVQAVAWTPPGGEPRWFRWANRGVFDSNGKLAFFQGFGIDITDLTRTEQALRKSREHLMLITDSLPLMIAHVASDFKILFVNKAHCDFFSSSRTDTIGKFLWEILDVDLFKKLRPHFDRVLSGSPVELESVDISKQGQIVHTRTSLIPEHSQQGGVNSFFVVIADVTDLVRAEESRRNLENQLQQAMKMEAIGRLAGGVAHDFNNLLTGISGNISLALLDLDPQSDASAALADASICAQNAASLTKQLLSFSRKNPVEPQVVDLIDLVSRTQRLLARLIGEDIELKTILHPQTHRVTVDPGQFEQVLINLAINARDAMPSGGTLRVESSNHVVDNALAERHPQLLPGPHVKLTISDSGHGMSKEVLSHVFEPFFTTKPSGRGTGLGLATAYGVILQAQGAIEVESQVGLGTTFRIYLPSSDPPEVPPSRRSEADGLIRGSETILVVEDEAAVRNFVVRVLGRLGYQVIQAVDGPQALNLAETHKGRIDLILSDVVMPGMNGRELVEQFLPLHPEAAVLFTSGYSNEVISHHGVLSDTIYFLSKPYTVQDLSTKIRSALKKSSSLGV